MVPQPIWTAPGLQLYRGDLLIDPAAWSALLTPDEIARATRYGDPVLRRRFVVRRGMLRKLLGHDAPFRYGEHGKPYIGDREFSVSSSRDLALFLLSSIGPVGVDIEWIDPTFDFEGILEADSPEAFFRAWTRREAIAKAGGTGIVEEPPNGFNVENLPLIDYAAVAVAWPSR